MFTKHTLSSLLATSMALVVSAVAWGMDTDVYLKPPSIYRNDAPNILIILDNSGSMSSNYITTRVPYDATITYTGSFDNTKVYWSTSGSPPSSSTNNWLLATDNHCQASFTALGSSAGAGGFFNSINTVGWIWDVSGSRSSTTTSTTTGHWGNLVSGTNRDGAKKMKDMECVEDNPAEPGYTALNNQTNLAYTSRYVSGSSNNLAFTGYSAATFYSGNYLNWYNNTTYSTTQSRWQIAQGAVNRIVDANPGVNLGLMVFNTNNTSPDGGRVVSHIQSMSTSAARTSIKTIVNGMTADTYTPLAETMWEAYRYMSGQSVTYGNPTGMTPAADLCAQDNVSSPCTMTGRYVTPFTQACQKSYIILVTDGDPTNDSAANTNISSLISGSVTTNANGSLMDELTEYMFTHDLVTSLPGNQVVVTYTVGFGSGISASGLQLLQDTARRGGNAGKMPNQGYYTANDDVELTNAIQSAIVDALQVTTSFTAPALSVNAFNTLYNRDEVYFAMFKPGTTVRWNGNVKKYTLCNDTSATPSCVYGEILDSNNLPAVDPTTLRIKDTATSFWPVTVDGNQIDKGGAGAQVPSYTTRNVYTYTGTYDANNILPSGGTAVDLTTSSNVVTTTNSAITLAMLGVSTSTARDDLINWIRGQDVYDENLNTVTAEDRSWKFYDPVHSRPVVVNYGGTSTNPILKIFVGTNDGLLRMINEKTGAEEWAFLPQELLGKQQEIADNAQGAHDWGIDGTVSIDVQDKSKDGSGSVVNIPDGIIDPSIGDFVHLYVGMRRGGNNIYALDVTPTSTLTSPTSTGGIHPKLMWVIHGGYSTGYTALSQTWSQPLVRRMWMGTGAGTGASAQSKVVKGLFFAGGYDTVNDTNFPAPTTTLGNAIYIADPLTGQLIWWASSSTSTADLKLSGMNYSIPSDLAVLDTDGDGQADRIYVGDVAGQIWRIDLSPTLMVGANNGSSGHVLADLGCTSGSRPSCTGTSNQDRRRFFYPPSVGQVIDTTYASATDAKYDVVAIGSGDREDPLDYLTQNLSTTPVHNRIYALRDYNIGALSTGGSMTYQATIHDSDLYDATAGALLNASATTITASGIKSKMGWYINLVDSSGAWVGEKVLSKTDIFGGVMYVTTFTPASAATASTTCSANEGLGKVYGINVLNGAAGVDLNGNGTIDASDRSTNVAGGIPSEQVVILRPGGATTLTGTACGGANCGPGMKLPGGSNRYETNWYQ